MLQNVKYEKKKIKIKIDIPTRWNSAYKLLQNFIKYKNVIQLYEMQLTSNCDIELDVLSDYDWQIVDILRDLFENFDVSTNIFCGVYYPTSHRVIMQITCNVCCATNTFTFTIYSNTDTNTNTFSIP